MTGVMTVISEHRESDGLLEDDWLSVSHISRVNGAIQIRDQ